MISHPLEQLLNNVFYQYYEQMSSQNIELLRINCNRYLWWIVAIFHCGRVIKYSTGPWFHTATTNSSLWPQEALWFLTGLMIWPLGLPWAATETVLRPQGALSAYDQVAEPLRFFCACSKEARWSCDLSHLWWSCRESTVTLLRPLVAHGDLTELLETLQGLVVWSDDL